MFADDSRARRGRGAVSNPAPRHTRQTSERHFDHWHFDPADEPERIATEVLPDSARSVIARNTSPDINFDRSINPYKGCEHGCVYCFARPTHAYLDLSPGLDFETRLFYKADAAQRLREELARPGYRPALMGFGTNTDPYQPIERQLGIMRDLLEVMLETRHPLSIVTKGSLIERDLDLLRELAARELVTVMISVTTLDDDTKRIMEPRAASPARRLRVIRALRAAGVPTGVLVAPVVPAITDHEVEAIVAAVAEAGAQSVGYVMLRLPLELKSMFADWLRVHYPDRAGRVMSLVHDMRGGRAYDSTWGLRQTGTGVYADMIRRRFEVARRRHGLGERDLPAPRCDLFRPPDDSGQMGLF